MKEYETLVGRVEQFSMVGRALGYPTANFKSKINLKDGIYFGFGDLAEYQHYPALIFIGAPVTVGDKVRRVEAHLLDIPDKDYYGLNISLVIKKFHRSSETFNNIDELKAAMKNDEKAARKWFKLRGLSK